MVRAICSAYAHVDYADSRIHGMRSGMMDVLRGHSSTKDFVHIAMVLHVYALASSLVLIFWHFLPTFCWL